jgi:hypothetical protein
MGPGHARHRTRRLGGSSPPVGSGGLPINKGFSGASASTTRAAVDSSGVRWRPIRCAPYVGVMLSGSASGGTARRASTFARVGVGEPSARLWRLVPVAPGSGRHVSGVTATAASRAGDRGAWHTDRPVRHRQQLPSISLRRFPDQLNTHGENRCPAPAPVPSLGGGAGRGEPIGHTPRPSDPTLVGLDIWVWRRSR